MGVGLGVAALAGATALASLSFGGTAGCTKSFRFGADDERRILVATSHSRVGSDKAGVPATLPTRARSMFKMTVDLLDEFDKAHSAFIDYFLLPFLARDNEHVVIGKQALHQ